MKNIVALSAIMGIYSIMLSVDIQLQLAKEFPSSSMLASRPPGDFSS